MQHNMNALNAGRRIKPSYHRSFLFILMAMYILFLIWHTISAFMTMDAQIATIRLRAFEKAAATLYLVLCLLTISCAYFIFKDSPQMVRLASKISIIVGFMTFSIEIANVTLYFLLKDDIIRTCQQYILVVAFPNNVDTYGCYDLWNNQAPWTVVRTVLGVILSAFYPLTVIIYSRLRLHQGDHHDFTMTFGEKDSNIKMNLTSSGRTDLRETINATLQRTKDVFASKIALGNDVSEDAKDREAMLPFQSTSIAGADIPVEKYSLPKEEDTHEDIGDRVLAREYI